MFSYSSRRPILSLALFFGLLYYFKYCFIKLVIPLFIAHHPMWVYTESRNGTEHRESRTERNIRIRERNDSIRIMIKDIYIS